jgi:uncharacterized protein (TIGR03435 family)
MAQSTRGMRLAMILGMPATLHLRTPTACTVLALVGGAFAIHLSAQQRNPVERPKFEVASIKAHKGCRPGRDQHQETSPGRVQMSCVTLESLIQLAYVSLATGVSLNRQTMEITGGPDWMHTDWYDLEAKAEGDPGRAKMSGPMLQTLLEDRFQLRIHRATKNGPVYALVVARNGPKLQPFKNGDCMIRDLDHLPPPPQPGQPKQYFCDEVVVLGSGGEITLEGRGMKMAEFVQGLVFDSLLVDRPVVIDKTGFSASFDFFLKCSPTGWGEGGGDRGGKAGLGAGRGNPAPAANSSNLPTISVALQEQLGLKLTPETGPVEFLVVDHAERPSEN